MSGLRIELEDGNAAFDDDARGKELARILRQLADELENMDDGAHGLSGPLFDHNGNRSGSFELEARPENFGKPCCNGVGCATCAELEDGDE